MDESFSISGDDAIDVSQAHSKNEEEGEEEDVVHYLHSSCPSISRSPPYKKPTFRFQHRPSLATSTPYSSEKEFWVTSRGNLEEPLSLQETIERWKHRVAAKARVVSEPGRGRCSSRFSKLGIPQLNPDETTTDAVKQPQCDLFEIPASLQLEYMPIHWSTKGLIAVVSAMLALCIGTLMNLLGATLLQEPGFWTIPELVVVVFVAYLLVSTTLSWIYQEISSPPTRMDTEELHRNDHLPSSLSVVDTVQVVEEEESQLDVHYLRLEQTPKQNSKKQFDAIYCNHGLGASSLSYLPVLRLLSENLHASNVLGHDTVGFGFTERPPCDHMRDLYKYGFSYSAGIGLALLDKVLHVNTYLPEQQRVVLMGHSMGSLTTLRMALRIPANIQVHVVLIAPAVLATHAPPPTKTTTNGNHKGTQERKSAGKQFWGTLSSAFGFFLHLVVPVFKSVRLFLWDYPTCFLLRRIIAWPAFWRWLLGYAFGGGSTPSESDIERYRWPSVADKCDWGVMNFLRAQSFCHGFLSYPGGDIQLLLDTLNRPNIQSVSVIHGDKDPIVPIMNSRRFLRLLNDHPKIRFNEMKGLGHCPHEESPESFINVLKECLASSSK